MATQEVNLESLKKDLDSLKADFKNVIKSIKDMGAERAESAKDKSSIEAANISDFFIKTSKI